MTKSKVSDTTAGTVLSSRWLANRPMIKINGKVHYLSSGTSMRHAGGKVVELFENTWMRACGVGKLEIDGSRKINKMGNTELLLDVDEDRNEFDLAVINTIRTAIPEFNARSLEAFYAELMEITHEDASTVRRGVSSSLGKMAVEDLLLSGALSKDSPFFTQTTIGKEIRQKGLETYGFIEVREEIDVMTGRPVIIDYPAESDADFEYLNDTHLPNNDLSNIPSKNSHYAGRNVNQFFSPPVVEESKSRGLDNPSVGMIILAACIPIIGWAYLLYIFFNAHCNLSTVDDEERPLRIAPQIIS